MLERFVSGIKICIRRKLSQIAQRAVNMSNSYKEAIATLNKLQSNAEYIKHAKIKNNQENNMTEMVKFLNRSGVSLEQLDSLPIIHIAGTNGKGTTCSYCENILRNHGYKTGFYSSPHMLEVRERIRLNGVPISQEKFADYFWKIFRSLDRQKSASYDMPLYFRFLTIMALHVFLTERVDVAILEVGIGGEYDCTNIVRKTLVAGITPLDIDHTTLLGNTLESITWNKAGIMKPGARVFTAAQPDNAMKVLRERSSERNCNLHVVDDFYTNDTHSSIPVHIQKTNASLALSISRSFMKLHPKERDFDLGLAKKAIEITRWPGRYQIIQKGNCSFYLDGAHTVQSMQVCSEWFTFHAQQSNDSKRVLMFNITGERDPESLLKLLVNCHFDMVMFLPNVGDDNDTSDNEDQIQPILRQLERCHSMKRLWDNNWHGTAAVVVPSFGKALRNLKSRTDERFQVLVTGSIHLVGAAMSVLDPTLGGML